jgi:hypothetical protein
MRWQQATSMSAVAALALACGGRSFSAGAATSRSASDLQQGIWNELTLGGDTRCARGGAYSFWVHPGTTNEVVIDFMGGGACWNDATCRAGDFTQDVSALRQVIDFGYEKGIYDRDNPDNPFANDWHVIVPYCTGDIHWGDATVTYGTGANLFEIHHKGAVNTRAVLQWVERNLAKPERVFVTGCSAGAYGSALWSAHVMKHYQGIPVVQFGDSGAGIITDDFFRQSFPSWNAEPAFPSFIEALDPSKVDLRQKSLSDLYIGVAQAFPENRMSQFNHTEDASQLLQYTRMGGTDPAEWTRRMLASVRAIDDATENFASFSVAGDAHCALVEDDFYEVEAGGKKLVRWLGSSLKGRVESVSDRGR